MMSEVKDSFLGVRDFDSAILRTFFAEVWFGVFICLLFAVYFISKF